ncbi:MAG TPA: DUF2339 domain-containing protein [Gaiellaceae bacterium]|nr:DUF2339 domain-containing protein [Gaiellaceae bacterium]
MSEHDTPGTELAGRLDSIERRLDALREELAEVRTLARAASPEVEAVTPPRPPVAVYQPARSPAPSRRPASRQPQPAARPTHPPAQPVAGASRLPRAHPTASELVERWQLLGPRGFAIVGGAVTALGIGLLFVLAVDRGWIGPAERVLIGAVLSALVFGAGLVVRARYGQLFAALAAVGAGTAGAYATLAAATARYDLVPDPLALPLAGLIAALTTAVALAWGSQILAGIGLVGSALAPALQALDTGMMPGSAAFAVIVLAATAVVAARRDWEPLLATVALIVTGQTLVLVADNGWAGDTGAVSVALALAGTLLGAGILLRQGRGSDELAPLAATLPLAGTGVALLTAARLLEHGTDRGAVLLAVAGVWAVAWLALRARDRALALVVGASSLALLAVATAELLSDDALALAWAAQAILLSALAMRLRDARLQLGGLVYLALAGGHALVVDAPPRILFEPASADPAASAALGATALAALVAGLAAPVTHVVATETGVLAFLSGVRVFLEQRRTALRESLFFVSGSLGVLASAVLLTGITFEAGHVAASGIAATAAAAALGVAARMRSTGLVVAALAALVLVLGESVWDADEFLRGDDRSPGGWSMLLTAAGLLGGTFALRVLHPTRRRLGIVSAVAAFVSLAWSASALTLLVPRADGVDPSETWLGLGLLPVALVYGVLAASVFGPGRLRNLSTTLWAPGVVATIAAEAYLLQDGRLIAAVAAVTGGLLALTSLPLREVRLALAGAIVTGFATAGTLAFVTPPERFLEASAAPADGLWVLAACLAGGAAVTVAFRAAGRNEWRAVGIALGALTLYAVSLGILGLVVGVSGASVETDFERAHTVVSAVWALVGLTALVAGLLRGSAALRLGGLGLFGVSLAKIFIYDLSELSSVARAASFILVGAAILVGGAALQRLSAKLDTRDGSAGTTT